MAHDPTKRRIWFTSDTHFHHKRICELAARPWQNADEMAKGLISRWNERIALTDIVFHLGDFSMGSKKRAEEILAQLNGEKLLIRGNHDHNCHTLFEWWKDLYVLKVQDPLTPGGIQRIVLCHFPILLWDRRHYGAWHLHGHSHGNLEDDPTALRMDVGVDAISGYAPISYEAVRMLMMKKPCWPVSKSIDHHEERYGE